MWKCWKNDIIRAFWLIIIVSAVALVLNQVRTPILNAAAENGRISDASAERLGGVNIIDSWWHKGWPRVAQRDTEPADNGNGEEENPQASTYQVDVPRGPEGQVWLVDLYQAKTLYDSGECIFFDARESEYYEEGHIADSFNWPYEHFDRYYDQYIEITRDDCIVIYCIGGACDESYQLGTSLVIEGFQEVYLFEGGMEAWEQAEFPVTYGPEP